MRDDYVQFIELVKKKTGIDLSLYKEGQMKRRLEGLRDKKGFSNFVDYFSVLSKDTLAMEEFLDRVTINVTEFYRNAKRWEVLSEKIIPRLLKENNNRLRVWSAACSTGEEPYTLVMILAKYLPISQINVFATDLDEKVIEKAKVGVYSERSLLEVPDEIKKKYFEKVPEGYKVIEEVKNRVSFKKQNLLEDSFDRDYDLIVCRNVMIYFTEPAKDELYHKFSNSLKKGGVLFVGSTEQIFNPSTFNFDTEDTFFYKKL